MAAKWDMILYRDNHLLRFFHGSLLFSHQKREIPDFKNFLKIVNPSKYPEDFFFSKVWLRTFNCSLSGSLHGKLGDCPPNSSLESLPGHIDMLTMCDSSYFIYNAVYAVAHALHELILVKTEMGSPGHTDEPMLLPWQVNVPQKQDSPRGS